MANTPEDKASDVEPDANEQSLDGRQQPETGRDRVLPNENEAEAMDRVQEEAAEERTKGGYQ